MKVILSRKGFDSQYGGYPSPILSDGKMISLPVPSNDSIHYSDIKLDENKTYYDLIKELNMDGFDENSKCHLDPDIRFSVKERDKEWKHLFGQANAAQGHLNNQEVKEADLFLFFGTFQKTIMQNGKLKFDPDDKPRHIIFGYLQVGKIIKNKKEIEEWMRYHSHCDSKRDWNRNNAVYVAKRRLSWNHNLPGAGVFKFNKKLVLTAENQPLKSVWNLPILKGKKISYHNERSWKNGFLHTVGRGQEFVIKDDSEVEDWAKGLIEELR